MGEDSGLVLASGEVVWTGKGRWLEPREWLGRVWSDECGVAPAVDALDVALRSNLAAYLAARGDFSAFTYGRVAGPAM